MLCIYSVYPVLVNIIMSVVNNIHCKQQTLNFCNPLEEYVQYNSDEQPEGSRGDFSTFRKCQ